MASLNKKKIIFQSTQLTLYSCPWRGSAMVLMISTNQTWPPPGEKGPLGWTPLKHWNCLCNALAKRLCTYDWIPPMKKASLPLEAAHSNVTVSLRNVLLYTVWTSISQHLHPLWSHPENIQKENLITFPMMRAVFDNKYVAPLMSFLFSRLKLPVPSTTLH